MAFVAAARYVRFTRWQKPSTCSKPFLPNGFWANGLVCWNSHQENGGTFFPDRSPFNFHGALSSGLDPGAGIDWYNHHAHGRCFSNLHTGGADRNIVYANKEKMQSMPQLTIFVRCRYDYSGSGGNFHMSDAWEAGQNHWLLRYVGPATSKWQFYVSGGGGTQFVGTAMTNTRWHCVCARWIGSAVGTANMWVDGVKSSTSMTRAVAMGSTADEGVRMQGSATSSRRFTGTHDHQLIWDRALTDAEISYLSDRFYSLGSQGTQGL